MALPDNLEINTDNLINFLSRGRTAIELSKEFGIPLERVPEILKQRTPKEFELFFTRNDFNQLIFLLLNKPKKRELKHKIWLPAIHKDERKPYLWIQLPDNLSWKKITIAPLYDIHYGAEGCDEKKFDEYIDWIAKTDNVFCILGGDNLENALADSPGGAIFEQMMRPQKQVTQFEEKIAPIAHKILWALPGGHEERSKKRSDIDPLYFICRNLGIPYYNQPIFADILWNGYVFSFYCHHGVTNSRTEGGKLNAASRPLAYTEFTMFYIMGHVHDEVTNPSIRICRERKFDESGNLVELRLVEKEQYVVIAPAFYKYWGTYAARSGYFPPSRGSVACILYANGNYEASS